MKMTTMRFFLVQPLSFVEKGQFFGLFQNYWTGPGNDGTPYNAQITWDFGAGVAIKDIVMKNGHNDYHNDR